MPKINYQNTIIYKIYSKDESITEIYIGHTTNFIKRRCSHKSTCYNEKSKLYNLKVYCYIRENGGWNNFNMIEIEKFACNNIKEASLRECYWVKELKANLNTNIPGRTKKEYCKDNREIILEKVKDFYEDNKEKILEYHKEYYLDNKEKITEYQKEYRKENKQKIVEYEKNRKNKKERLEKKKETIICKCGCKVSKGNLSRHLKSQKHQLLIDFKNEPFNNNDDE